MNNKTAHIIAIVLIALTAILVASTAIYRILRPAEAHVDIDRERYPIAGIDLSAHNGVPNFDSIAAAGIDFVYLKASEGNNFRDPAFARNYAAAKRVGLKVGAYHFFRFDCDGELQAANFLAATNECRFDLPLAIDIEESGNPSAYNVSDVVSKLAAMVSSLQSQGNNIMIYTNKNGDARFVRSLYRNPGEGDPELWICSFTDPPLSRRNWTFWQHSHLGTVPGVKGKVDLNTFNGNRAMWQQWLINNSAAQ